MDARKNSSRDHTPYAVIVKPRQNLEIKYPCEVRMGEWSDNSD
ncbi:MAG: hypothetical protein QXO04_00605 [Nitrososphaerota archaeon]